MHRTGDILHRHQSVGEGGAPHSADPCAQIRRRRHYQHAPAIVLERQAHITPNERNARHQLGDRPPLRTGGTQEAVSGRDIEEKPRNGDCGTSAAGNLAHLDRVAPCRTEPRSRAVLERSRELELGHRSYRRQRLTPKSEARHSYEIVQHADLGGRVPAHRQFCFLAAHPRSIIGYADPGPTAVLGSNLDTARTRIERILQQLLHHRRRPLDHFAGGDLIDDGVGENSNARHRRFSGGWERHTGS